jgi:hypothetical protein
MKVFISYPSERREIVNDLLGRLRDIKDFLIQDDKKSGDEEDIPQFIENGIDQSDLLVFFFSAESVNKPWIASELRIAEQREKEERFVIPVILPGEQESKLPEFLRKKESIRCATDSPRQKDQAREDLYIMLLSRLAKLDGKERGDYPIGGHDKPRGDDKMRALAGVYLPSLRQFYDECWRADNGTFFNVLIDMKEWFKPKLQIHLAVQDGMTHSMRLATMGACLLRRSKGKCASGMKGPLGMRFRRILFFPKTRMELLNDFVNATPAGRNLCSLMHIHNLIACPLAIVPVDDFAESIMPAAQSFFENGDVARVLGLPIEMGYADPRNPTQSYKPLRQHLKAQMNMADGEVKPSIDFAVFKINSMKRIWFGAVAKDQALIYYPLENLHNGIKRGGKNRFPPDLPGVKFDLTATQAELRGVLFEFADIVEKQVFYSSEEKGREFKRQEFEDLRDFFHLHPLAKYFGSLTRKNFNRIAQVRSEFCPWGLLSESLRHGRARHHPMPEARQLK